MQVESRTYGWPVETVLKAGRASLRVREIPVEVRPRAAGRSKVSGSWRASLRAGWCFVRAVIRHGLGPVRVDARALHEPGDPPG